MSITTQRSLPDLITQVSSSDASISVSELNNLSKTLLENNLPTFWVKGEVAGLKIYSHAYFDLKDVNSKISCVVFARRLAAHDFKLENGQAIEVRGIVTIYAPNGSYQINVEQIRKVGVGELYEAYQRLFNKLKEEGLFDSARKRALPILPKTVGVVTSKEGAVIRDVITTLKRRMPNIHIIVYHTLVQGQGAGMYIARAINQANLHNLADVLIVCRGGGSMQDLWCFNEEIVARTVYASKIPIISAVGHETDTTIIDLVADLRAATPTAAAELVAKSRQEWQHVVNQLRQQLDDNFHKLLNYKSQQLDLYHARLQLLNPINALQEKRKRIQLAALQLRSNLKQFVNSKRQRLQLVAMQLNLVNPTNILARGYVIVQNTHGKVIANATELMNNQEISITFAHDKVSATIINISHQ